MSEQADSDSGRYSGRPLLILAENFVLHSIGQLSVAHYRDLAALEPRLRQTFGREGSWIDVVKEVLHMPEGIEGTIRQMWDQNVRRFREAGQTADPVAFARAFADQNFLEPDE